MPSATELSQVVLSNLGPMTTVFTPPASCATASPQLFLAFTDAPRVLPFFGRDCEDDHPLGDCFPSGAAVDEALSSFRSSPSLDHRGTLYYLSPASVCPDGHTTVGVAAKNAGGEVSSSGLYVPPVWPGGDSLGREPRLNPAENIFMEALDAGETAVVCCPENFEAGRVDGCYSPVPFSVYGEPVTACYSAYTRDIATANATFTYNHTVVSGEVVSYTGGSISHYTTRTQTFGPDDVKTNDMGAFEGRAAVTLVYREAGQTTGSGTAAGPTETPPSAAARGWRMTTAGGGVGVLATAWTFAALVGVAVALPW